MVLDLIDKKIRKAFSDAAMHYDMLTSLHKEIGRELAKALMQHEPCAAVLDIGMGTGWFTKRLAGMFPDCSVVGIDFAPGMIREAQKQEGGFKIVQADAACLPFKPGTFDIITSNLAYQWVDDLSASFAQCHALLKEEGLLSLTMFGHDTFHELFTALNACACPKQLTVRRLVDEQKAHKALQQAGFAGIRIKTENIKVRFADMMDLVKWVKSIGANTLPGDVYLGRDLLLKANDYYNAHFKDRLGVYATFEVIWMEAGK